MDGAHDLGGRQGFGPVDRAGEDDAFHTGADARAYGLTVSLRAERAYPVDWFRHVRELIDPVDYLTRPYFDQWLQTAAAMAVDAGDLSMGEIRSGKAEVIGRTVEPLRPDDVRAMLRAAPDFSRPLDTAPGFGKGDAVRTALLAGPGHTRLPAYARGRRGIVHACRGAHIFADDAARGGERAEHLYTVGFEAAELWPEGGRDRVFLDLWEPFLERA